MSLPRSGRLSVEHAGNLRFLAVAGEHTVLLDALPEDGGGGEAMSAPQLFAAAVAACMLEFVANSCRLHGIPFERLNIEVEYTEQAQPRRIGALRAVLSIEPEPPEDVKRRLIGVARRATLVNTLTHSPEITICFGENDSPLPAGSHRL